MNNENMTTEDKLLNTALKAICLTRDYVGEKTLPCIKGWEWYEAGKEISKAKPHLKWSREFELRCEENEKETSSVDSSPVSCYTFFGWCEACGDRTLIDEDDFCESCNTPI